LRIPAIGFNNLQLIPSLSIGVVLLFSFIFIEHKTKHPMMPLQLFANKTFSGANLLSFFLYAGLGAGILFLTLNMVQVQHYSQLQAGLTLLPFTILMVVIARYSGSIVDKHGPRLLLILGPATAGLGLLLLSFVKETHGPVSYWSSFFPGILIFGLGMSFTVAPLTTTVMGSLPNHFSGTASGINNAVTRIAGVFANAIFGALAVLFFTNSLKTEINNVHLSAESKQAVMAETINLGNAKAPATLDFKTKVCVEKYYKDGFISAYGNIMRMCAGLALLGALMSFIFIKNASVKTKHAKRLKPV
jgi:MFS family permease